MVAAHRTRIDTCNRIYEHDENASVELRTESLQHLRELGPPDLVQLVKQPIKSTTKQVRVLIEPATAHMALTMPCLILLLPLLLHHQQVNSRSTRRSASTTM